MTSKQKTVIVTGASQGIGAGVVQAFLARGYNVVGTSRSATESKELSASDHLALIGGDIGQFETAQKSGGSIVSIPTSLVENPIAGPSRFFPYDHKRRPGSSIEKLGF
jgi:NAD(P)-dependent dehydrogenase (short-subunit alcohol dehydrogenase family)